MARLEVTINGVIPLGFPVILGERFEAESDVLNDAVKKQLEPGGVWLANAVCSRRIFELD